MLRIVTTATSILILSAGVTLATVQFSSGPRRPVPARPRPAPCLPRPRALNVT